MARENPKTLKLYTDEQLKQMNETQLARARRAAAIELDDFERKYQALPIDTRAEVITRRVNDYESGTMTRLQNIARIAKEEKARRKAYEALLAQRKQAKIDFAPGGPGFLEAERRFHGLIDPEDREANPFLYRDEAGMKSKRDADMALAGMALEGSGPRLARELSKTQYRVW